MQPTRLPLSGGSRIEGPVDFGLYNVKAYAVSQRTLDVKRFGGSGDAEDVDQWEKSFHKVPGDYSKLPERE